MHNVNWKTSNIFFYLEFLVLWGYCIEKFCLLSFHKNKNLSGFSISSAI
jgi:hypothetical protein